jgi:hypothetical protein
MPTLSRLRAAVGVVASVAVFVSVNSLSAQARASDRGTTAPPATGYDISYPQCSGGYPQHAGFGVVGVNDGIAWSVNPCLASEYAWAAGLRGAPQFYMNTANPAPHSSHYWPASGSSDPALCRDASSVADPGCSYDYGWHTAADALTTASNATSRVAATTHVWWLDVETGNTWNGTHYANAADVQGSIDYLRAQGIQAVGVYSTSYQWGQITGGYATNNSAAYSSAWSSEFTSPNGIAGSPDWVAGAGSVSQAARYCSRSFTGVRVRLSQYPSQGFDADYPCP